MKREFELLMPNTARLLLIWLGGLVLVIGLALGGMVLLLKVHPYLGIGWFVAAFGGGMWGMLRLAKTLGSDPNLVTLTAHSLTVLNRRTGQEQLLLFAELAAYRFSAFNGAEKLRLSTRDGRRLTLAVNTQMHEDQSLMELVGEFEAALELHRERNGEAGGPVREKSFFEQKISTLVLVLFTAALVLLTVLLVMSDKPVRGNVFGGYVLYIAYLVAWYAARERRSQ